MINATYLKARRTASSLGVKKGCERQYTGGAALMCSPPKARWLLADRSYDAEVVAARALTELDITVIGNALEPSCGDSWFVRTLSATNSLNIYALDKDEASITHYEVEFDESRVYCTDFSEDLPEAWSKKFGLNIGNLPYVSWHRCDTIARSRLDSIGEKHDFESRRLRNARVRFRR